MENQTSDPKTRTQYWPYVFPTAEGQKPGGDSFESTSQCKEYLAKKTTKTKKICMGFLMASMIIILLGAVTTAVFLALKPSRQRVTAVMKLRLNDSYSSIYEDLENPITKMKVKEITKTVDDAMKNTVQFHTTYIGSDVKRITNGSLIVILELVFESDSFLLKEEFRKSLSLDLISSVLMNCTLNILNKIDCCWKSTSNDYTCPPDTTTFSPNVGMTVSITMTSDTVPQTSTDLAAQTTTISTTVSGEATIFATHGSTNKSVTSSISSSQTESKSNPRRVWDRTTDPTSISGMAESGKLNITDRLDTATMNSEYPLYTMLTATSFSETRLRTNIHNAVSSPTLKSDTTTVTVNSVTGVSATGATGKQTSDATGKQTSDATGKQTSDATGKQTSDATGKQTSGATGKQTPGATGKQTPGASVFSFISDVSTQQPVSLNSQAPMNGSSHTSTFNDTATDQVAKAMTSNATTDDNAISITTESTPDKNWKTQLSGTTQETYTKITDPSTGTLTNISSTVYFFSTANDKAATSDYVSTVISINDSTMSDSVNTDLVNTVTPLMTKDGATNTDYPITRGPVSEITIDGDKSSNNVTAPSLISTMTTVTPTEIPSAITDTSTNIESPDINTNFTTHLDTSTTEPETTKERTIEDITEKATRDFTQKDMASTLVISDSAITDNSTTTMASTTTETVNTNDTTDISILITTRNNTTVTGPTVDDATNDVTATENMTNFQTTTEDSTASSITTEITTTVESPDDPENTTKQTYDSAISITTTTNIATMTMTDGSTISQRTKDDASTTVALIDKTDNSRGTSKGFATSATDGTMSFVSIRKSIEDTLSTVTADSKTNSTTLT